MPPAQIAPVTCLLSVLITRRKAAAGTGRFPAQVHLVFTARNADELTTMDPAILRAARWAAGYTP